MIRQMMNRLIPANSRQTEDEMAEQNSYLRQALTEEKKEGLRLSVKARWIALGIIAIFLPFLNFSPMVLYYEALLVCFAVIGWLQLRFGTVGHSGKELLIIFFDIALLTFTLVYPNPFENPPIPAPMSYHFNNFIYFFVLLAGATLAYSWRTVLSFGTWVAILWLAGLAWVALQPKILPDLSEILKIHLVGYERFVELYNPTFINVGSRIQEVVVFFLVAGILGLNGWRSSQLLLRQAAATRERANLARHFPPSIVDQIASRDQPLGAVRSQAVAVMFADIVGFTALAEEKSPDEVIALLREFHQQLEHAVFDNHGTLDKFLGDGIMATFGTPETTAQDAANAIACAHDMQWRIDGLNLARAGLGDEPLRLSIGIHFGQVILGDIGSERRLEFAALGDVVNVASRLEALTREQDVKILISDECLQQAKMGSPESIKTTIANYRDGGQQTLRGRGDPIHIWGWSG
jgi:adenylate cyclase